MSSLNNYKADGIDYYRICELYRTHYYKQEIREVRDKATDIINKKLEGKADTVLEQIGIDSKLKERLFTGDKDAMLTICDLLTEEMKAFRLSKTAINRFRTSCRGGGSSRRAFDALRKEVISGIAINLATEAGIYPSGWRRFQDNETSTTIDVTKKIEKIYGLTPAECEELEGCMIKNNFVVSKALSELSRQILRSRIVGAHSDDTSEGSSSAVSFSKEEEKAVINLIEDAELSESVWKNIKAEGKNIQQKTLLKLLIAYEADVELANNYMKTAGSGFYRKLDTVFLACISMGYVYPLTVRKVIDYFNEEKNIEILNPYNKK